MIPVNMEQLQSNHNNEIDGRRIVPMLSRYSIFCCDVPALNVPLLCIKNDRSDHLELLSFSYDNLEAAFFY